MVSVRWQFDDMREELGRLREEMDKWFARPASAKWFRSAGVAANMWEADQEFFVEFELPGIDREALEILVTGKELTLKGKREQPEMEQANWLRKERSYGEFERTLELPEEVDADKVEATYVDGVLRIKLPKREQAQPRRIQIKTT